MAAEPALRRGRARSHHRIADEIPESLAVRTLRARRWLTRFGSWLRAALSGPVAAVGGWLASAISGTRSPPEDITLDPSYYEQLVDLPQVPARPPLTKFERVSTAEATAIDNVTRIISRSVISSYCTAKTADRAAKATRGQHAKQHGCLQANFIVRQDLPAEFAVGVFQPGARYSAVVRFSNSMGSPKPDKERDGRGMAIKLRNVDGRALLADQLPQRGATEQDFLISGHPVFFCRNVADYTAFMTMLDMPRGTRGERFRATSKFILFFLCRPLRVFGAFAATASRPVKNPLTSDYHSMTPYLFGEDRVVRYVATPVAPRRGENSDTESDNYLRNALVETLNPARHPNAQPIAFDFSIQIRHRPTPADVEDANRQWRRRRDVKVSLARIEIPMQQFDVADQECACQDLSFNPWHCLPEHRPLGGLNRMRLAVYMASTQVRHRLNGI